MRTPKKSFLAVGVGKVHRREMLEVRFLLLWILIAQDYLDILFYLSQLLDYRKIYETLRIKLGISSYIVRASGQAIYQPGYIPFPL